MGEVVLPAGRVAGERGLLRPGSPNTSHSQNTRGPTVCAATAQIGQGGLS